MEIVNILALGIVIIFGGFGFISGFIKGTARLIGWIIALILAIKLGPASSVFFQETFHFAPKTGNILGGIIVFLIVMVLIAVIVKIMKKLVETLNLSFLDRLLGFLLGCFQAMIIIFLLSLVIQVIPVAKSAQSVILQAGVPEWSNEKIARILNATGLDSQIKENRYYQELLNLQYKLNKTTEDPASVLQ
ncbi:MAG TPA: CvpA family protein [Candidatus Cloacimonetes bacterium]|nr:CvpA family protein [Candidatus Cloacimonadota bacterium]